MLGCHNCGSCESPWLLALAYWRCTSPLLPWSLALTYWSCTSPLLAWPLALAYWSCTSPLLVWPLALAYWELHISPACLAACLCLLELHISCTSPQLPWWLAHAYWIGRGSAAGGGGEGSGGTGTVLGGLLAACLERLLGDDGGAEGVGEHAAEALLPLILADPAALQAAADALLASLPDQAAKVGG